MSNTEHNEITEAPHLPWRSAHSQGFIPCLESFVTVVDSAPIRRCCVTSWFFSDFYSSECSASATKLPGFNPDAGGDKDQRHSAGTGVLKSQKSCRSSYDPAIRSDRNRDRTERGETASLSAQTSCSGRFVVSSKDDRVLERTHCQYRSNFDMLIVACNAI